MRLRQRNDVFRLLQWMQKSIERIDNIEIVCVVIEDNVEVVLPVVFGENFGFSKFLLLWRGLELLFFGKPIFFMIQNFLISFLFPFLFVVLVKISIILRLWNVRFQTSSPFFISQGTIFGLNLFASNAFALELWVLVPGQMALADDREIISCCLFEFEEASDLIGANLFIFGRIFIFEEVVKRQGRLLVDEQIVGVVGMEFVLRSIVIALSSYPLHLDLAEAACPLEVGVIECLLSRDPLFWIHLQHALQQIQPLLVDLPEITALNGLKIVNFWKFHSNELGILEEVLLVLGSERSQAFLDEVQLVQIVLPWEERLAVDAFSHNTADRPNINGLVVVVSADEQFGRTVPARGHVVSHDAIGRNAACEPQVADLNCSLFADQDVLGLDVPVDDVDGVHVGDAAEQPEGVVAYLSGSEGRLLQHLQQVLLNVLADEVDPALLAEGLLEFNDVFVAEGLQDFNLAQDDPLVLLVRVILLELFDGHEVARLLVAAFQDDPVLPLPDALQNFVFIHRCNNFKQRPSPSIPYISQKLQLSPQYPPFSVPVDRKLYKNAIPRTDFQL